MRQKFGEDHIGHAFTSGPAGACRADDIGLGSRLAAVPAPIAHRHHGGQNNHAVMLRWQG